MKIGILGSGVVGRALADGFVESGHEVKIGTRNVSQEKIAGWLSQHRRKATAGTFEETVKFGDLLVIALPWSAAQNIAEIGGGAKNFNRKVVIDVTNPIDFSSSFPTLSVGFDTSAGEIIQNQIPNAKVIKALNTINSSQMVNPNFGGQKPTMYICGNDDSAKSQINKILSMFGWDDVIDLGDITMSRYIEPMAMVYIVNAFRTNNWNVGFKLLRV